MSYNNSRAGFNAILSLAFGSITTTYVSMGTIAVPTLAIGCVNGIKDASGNLLDVFISFDGTTNHLILLGVAPGVAFDVRTNAPMTSDYMLPANTTVYAKTAGTPASGSVYAMALVARVGA